MQKTSYNVYAHAHDWTYLIWNLFMFFLAPENASWEHHTLAYT